MSAALMQKSTMDVVRDLGRGLDRMVEIQMTAYPSIWTEQERREAAEEYLYGRKG